MEERPTILVVEDCDSTRLILDHALRGAGFNTSCVPSVQEALLSLRNLVPMAAVVDAILKDDSGFTVCRTLRTDARFSKVKIILTSGVAEVQHQARSFQGAFDVFMDKPFSLRVMVEHLR